MTEDNFGLPEGRPTPDQVDVMAQQVVPQLYRSSNPRVLNPDADVSYEGCRVIVRDVDPERLRVVLMMHDGLSYNYYNDGKGKPKGLFSFESGYMMPPTSPLGDQFARPLARRLKETESMAVFWAPYGRGTENPWTQIGRLSAEKIQNYVANCVRDIFTKFDYLMQMRHWIGGHSKGGQSASILFNNPVHYRLRRGGDLDGLYAVCPVPLPYSQVMLFNKAVWTQLVPGGLWPVVRSLMTGKGAAFDERKGRKFFVGNDDQLIGEEAFLTRLFPDSARYFLETLTTGSSKSVPKGVHDYPVSAMYANGDRIVNAGSARAYCKAMGILPAGTSSDERMARQSLSVTIKGDHMSPFYMNTGEGGDSPADVARAHYLLLSNVMDLG